MGDHSNDAHPGENRRRPAGNAQAKHSFSIFRSESRHKSSARGRQDRTEHSYCTLSPLPNYTRVLHLNVSGYFTAISFSIHGQFACFSAKIGEFPVKSVFSTISHLEFGFVRFGDAGPQFPVEACEKL
jgi:hypothetical protein